MIASIQGEVIGLDDNSLVIRVGGLGIKVYATGGLCRKKQTGDSIFLHTYLVVREDALSLYGFETEDERDFFVLLLGVNGVGPRTSLSVLSTLSVDAMKRAVLGGQADAFSRVPGVGKKTAQKILLHLDGKIKGEVPLQGLGIKDVDAEVLEALTALGYSVVEAQAALQSLPKDAPEDVEGRLRLALQYFAS